MACVTFGVAAPGVVAVDETAGEEEAFGCVAAASLAALVRLPATDVPTVGVEPACVETGTPGTVAVEFAVDGVALPCVAVVVAVAVALAGTAEAAGVVLAG
jgi:hypothetical protein